MQWIGKKKRSKFKNQSSGSLVEIDKLDKSLLKSIKENQGVFSAVELHEFFIYVRY